MSRPALANVVAELRPSLAAVSAPAGYGKTTLMVEWARQNPRPSAWVSLDRVDNDPLSLLGLVATALDAVNPVDPVLVNDLASPGVSVMGRVVPRLAAWVLTTEPFLLLLDDLHEIEDQECRDVLTLLVDHLPPGFTVAAASRGEVWLGLARRRTHGQLLEIGAASWPSTRPRRLSCWAQPASRWRRTSWTSSASAPRAGQPVCTWALSPCGTRTTGARHSRCSLGTTGS